MNRPPPLPGHRFKVSVYVRSDRRWPLWVRITDRLTGRVVREALEGLTVRQKARAYARALERQNQLNSVTSVDLKPVDWKTACAEFLDLMAAERRPATAYLYRQVLKRFGEFCTETIARRRDTFFLSEITVVAARQYITWRKQRNWKRDQAGAENSTVNKHLRMLRAAWAWWKKTGYVQANPWAELSPLAEMKRHRRRLSIEERDRLLAVAGEFGIRFETALALALESGMRLGEISHVTWHHLDVDGRELLITREATCTRIRSVP
jgi:site-specific recombinase XerD